MSELNLKDNPSVTIHLLIKYFGGIIIFLVIVAVIILGQLNGYEYVYYGAFSGKVVDMETGKPVEGALVYFKVQTETIGACNNNKKGFWEFCQQDEIETHDTTDASGEYYLRRKKIKSFVRQNKNIPGFNKKPNGLFFIYKKGYVGYSGSKIFPCNDNRTDFKEKDHVAKLEPWRNDYFHTNHKEFIPQELLTPSDKYLNSSELLKWEFDASRKEKKDFDGKIPPDASCKK